MTHPYREPMLPRGRPLRVYLVGPSAELDRVFAAMNAVTAAGHEITEHWWARIDEAARSGWAHDSEVPADYMHESARRNREGILNADVVIALARSTGGFSSGCAGEIGYSLAERDAERIERDKKLVILVGDCKGFVWSWLVPAEHRVATMVDALALLSRLV